MRCSKFLKLMNQRRIERTLAGKWRIACASTWARRDRELATAHRHGNFLRLSVTNDRDYHRAFRYRPTYARQQFVTRAYRDVIPGGDNVAFLQSKQLGWPIGLDPIQSHSIGPGLGIGNLRRPVRFKTKIALRLASISALEIIRLGFRNSGQLRFL